MVCPKSCYRTGRFRAARPHERYRTRKLLAPALKSLCPPSPAQGAPPCTAAWPLEVPARTSRKGTPSSADACRGGVQVAHGDQACGGREPEASGPAKRGAAESIQRAPARGRAYFPALLSDFSWRITEFHLQAKQPQQRYASKLVCPWGSLHSQYHSHQSRVKAQTTRSLIRNESPHESFPSEGALIGQLKVPQETGFCHALMRTTHNACTGLASFLVTFPACLIPDFLHAGSSLLSDMELSSALASSEAALPKQVRKIQDVARNDLIPHTDAHDTHFSTARQRSVVSCRCHHA